MKKKIYAALFLVFFLIMSLLTIFGDNGLLRAFRLKGDLEKLTRTNASLRRENTALMEEIGYLRGDRRYLELQAHKQGLVRQGEIIFRFEKER
ncbi:MAG: septum formation initiator family protein [Deltaproteobacteria bacterium]|nr:septum formation initiator family protein [Deltaproteobacteria bacterium]MBW2121791.1 septum formation initiator family protein [Deltaproteobacteria bacterium]